MSKVIIYTEQDGNVCVIHPAEGRPIEESLRFVPEGCPHQIVDKEVLPADRYFRAAWRSAPGGVDIDIEAAKECQRNVWRKLREPKLKALDLEVMKAVERGDAKKRGAVADQKDALRDVTKLPLPDDLAAIRNTIPEILL